MVVTKYTLHHEKQCSLFTLRHYILRDTTGCQVWVTITYVVLPLPVGPIIAFSPVFISPLDKGGRACYIYDRVKAIATVLGVSQLCNNYTLQQQSQRMQMEDPANAFWN